MGGKESQASSKSIPAAHEEEYKAVSDALDSKAASVHNSVEAGDDE